MSSKLLTRIYEIAVDPPIIAEPNMSIGDVLPKMRDLKVRVVPVVSGGRLVGVLSYKGILLSGVGRMARVRSVMDPPYGVDMMGSIDDAVAKFVLWKAKALPVISKDNELVGYLSRYDLMDFLLSRGLIPRKRVEDVMTSPPTVIMDWESLARARWLMLRNGISRLPVTNDAGNIDGVITMTDIVEKIYFIRMTRRKGFEQFEEEFLAAPVKDFMSSPPICSSVGDLLEDVVKTLIDRRVTGLPVVKESKVVGVISSIDVLRAYAEQLVSKELIEAKIPESLRVDDLSKSQVETLINEYLSNIRRVVNVINFQINIKEESKGGRKRYVVRSRLTTDDGVMVSEGSGWDLLSSIKDSLEKLENRVKKYRSRARELRRRSKPEQ
ncbi:MAG: CBS domain-containing protein [Sulfolobales archaeon]